MVTILVAILCLIIGFKFGARSKKLEIDILREQFDYLSSRLDAVVAKINR